MALIKGGTAIIGISGSIGATTFVLSRNGPYVRTKCRQLKRRTQAQLHAAAARQLAQRYWHDLTDLQRLAWQVAALSHPVFNRLGVPHYPTAYQLFLKHQIRRAFWNFPFNPNPLTPTFTYLPKKTFFTFTEGGPFTITIDITPIWQDAIILAARSFSSTLKFSPRAPKTIGKYQFTKFDPFNIYPDFVAALGDPPAGEAVYVSITITQHPDPYAHFPPYTATTTIT